ncbi:DHA2 family efflux MFS transporter permease subunit [Peribacillus muralis]|uniref:DHA2 family efflux MFS transporter permease subunit n=1 Tax=Peribacillus muralis TaxID=264697 RepID=UPI000708A77D|nr:DHA2 family efflux MFS transporter permease subunit [Peribacillus muralis]
MTKIAEDQPNINTHVHYNVVPIMIALLLSGFIGMFSETALNVALSQFMIVFDISASTAQWLTTGYLLTIGILVPISALLMQWFTTRQLFITSITLSLIGTVIAALSPFFDLLLTGRIIQAIGMAILLPLIFNTILVIFPPEKRGMVMGFLGLVLVVAPAIGPTLSGIILESLGWEWIFWIPLPLYTICLLIGIRYIQNVSTITKPKIDVISIFTSTLGFGGIVFALSSLGESTAGIKNSAVMITTTIGFVSLIVFVTRQLKMEQPMLNLRAFKYPMFTLGTFMIFSCMMFTMVAMIVLPMFLIQGFGLNAIAAGLVLLPGGILQALMSPVTGRLFDKFGPKWLIPLGLSFITVALLFFSNITLDTHIAIIVVLHSLLMIGICLVWMPAQTNGLNQLPPSFYPDGSAIMNTLQQIAGAIGTAVAITIITLGVDRFMQDSQNQFNSANESLALVAGTQESFIFVLIVAIIGLICSLFIKKVKLEEQ